MEREETSINRSFTSAGYVDCLAVSSRPHSPHQSEAITAEKDCDHVDEMLHKLLRMCPKLVAVKQPILLHDNARPHVSVMKRQKLHELSFVPSLCCRPHSTDLSPTDYHYSTYMDNILPDKCFKSQEHAKSPSLTTKSPDFYATGINKLFSFLLAKIC